MTEKTLLSCPFCGAGETQIKEHTMWTGQKNAVLSVSIIHWCEKEEGQPSRAIERIGKDEESAIKAWNKRSLPVVKLVSTLLDGTPAQGVWPFPAKLRAAKEIMESWRRREDDLGTFDEA